MDIDRFDGEYRFLSNFFPSPVRIRLSGIDFPTVEHAYQAAKTLNLAAQFLISRLPTPGHAKREGQKLELRPDWDAIKLEVMVDLLQQKFTVEPLRSKLLATAPFHLTEGNTWGDTFWGVCNGRGHNHLGKMLMEIRDRLEKGDLQ